MPATHVYIDAVSRRSSGRPDANIREDLIHADRGKTLHEKKCGQNWGTAKKLFEEKKISAAEMRSIGAYRKALVDSILHRLRAQHKNLEFMAVGSTNPTSDYDITIGGAGDTDAMKEFHTIFRSNFPAESGLVFDTNLYVANYLPAREYFTASSLQYAIDQKTFTVAEENVADSARKTGPKDIPDEDCLVFDGITLGNLTSLDQTLGALAWECQDEFALTKLRKYHTGEDWRTYRSTLDAELDQQADKEELRQRLDNANRLVLAYARTVLAKIGVTGVPDTDLENRLEQEENARENTVFAARNDLYAQYADQARRNLRNVWKMPRESETDKQELRGPYRAAMEDLTLSLMFALEAYHSGSAIKDVVVNQQGNKNLPLTRGEYRDSLNDQFGDLLKDLHHYGGDLEGDRKALIQSSKYLKRFCFAGTQLQARTECPLDPSDPTKPLERRLNQFTTLTTKGDYPNGTKLLAIREPTPEFAEFNQSRRNQAAVDEYQKATDEVIYTLTRFKRFVLDLNLRLNHNSRSSTCKKKPLTVSRLMIDSSR
ncbi:hypothetical protein QZH56_00520 [Streptomyces olivoreticuli]|uniref:hypothetical protein n=1 Tax=Streptomyces olivoreticuli TaxID=68246 RepID=UPI002658B36C|nr:hypothetical protein [Streptomyces olivoreticuli]WKK24213.1 hypothetical protein QZH56_00520 [Streptomyces olivoreticuli]